MRGRCGSGSTGRCCGPRDSHDLKLRSATLAVSPRAEVRWVHDVFGNSITLLDFQQPDT